MKYNLILNMVNGVLPALLPLYAVAETAIPHVSVTNVRTEPSHVSEMSTQALMGTPLKVTGITDNDWVEVEMPDGYTGYVIGNSLTMLDDDAYDEWRCAPRLMVTSRHEIRAYEDSVSFVTVSDLVPGDIVEQLDGNSQLRIHIKFPDGREGWVHKHDVAPLEKIADTGVDDILEMARAQMGTPYLWGGLSVKGMDCSGLTKLAFFSAGYILPRDASMQALAGRKVNIDSLQPGDLVFYGNPATGRINHVAIYEGMGNVIEAAGMVRRTPLNDAGQVITARRLNVASTVTVTQHPAYSRKEE